MTKEKLDDIDLIDDDINKIIKKSYERRTGGKTQKVRSTVEKAKDDWKAAKTLHNDNIKKAKREIKSYRLMRKQAKNTYKLIALQSKG